jgi:L-asparagine oxygenase
MFVQAKHKDVKAGSNQGPHWRTGKSEHRTLPSAGAPDVLVGEIDVSHASDEIADELVNGIGTSSFNPDVHFAEMAGIGATAVKPVLDDFQLATLRDFATGKGAQAVVIKGLPVPAVLPPTPQEFCDDADMQFTDILQFGVIEAAGLSPVAYGYENFGRVVRNVAPSSRAVKVASSHGSQVPLGWHTDDPCGPFEGLGFERSPIPRFLTFFGVRNADGNGEPVPTEILPVRAFLRLARPEHILELEKHQFIVNPPASNRCGSFIAPIVEYDYTGEPFVRFNAADGQIQGVTPRAQTAITELCDLLQDCDHVSIKVFVNPGTIFMFDNYRVLHSRRSFDPGEDLSKARWLRRCFACQSPDNGQFIDRVHRPLVWK